MDPSGDGPMIVMPSDPVNITPNKSMVSTSALKPLDQRMQVSQAPIVAIPKAVPPAEQKPETTAKTDAKQSPAKSAVIRPV